MKRFIAPVLALVLAATARAQLIEGLWYDTETEGYYEFSDSLSGDFIHHLPGGQVRTGTYQYLNTDNEGRMSFKVILEGGDEKDSYFVRINPDGQTGYRQYKCMKYPIYRRKDS
jgi:hypothetical protein